MRLAIIRPPTAVVHLAMPWSKDQMAARAAREVEPGSIVNLGIGLPTLVADHIPPDADVMLQSENGLLGMGPFPYDGDEDSQIINAGKQTVTIVPGGSCFDSALSFAMIRGGHVDLTIMGAMQVSARGDLANWAVPGGKLMGIGGAMDLSSGSRRTVILMNHVTREGEPKLVAECSYPLTARGVVHRIVTELGVLDVTPDGFRLVELADGVSGDEVRRATGAPVTE
jgi:3-oxoacid CoA-transferase subunit B